MFSNLKDVFAYFGPAALIHRPTAECGSIRQDAPSQSTTTADHPTLQFLAGAVGAPFHRDS
jgi:hypothetical protein